MRETRKMLKEVPIWEANVWIARLGGTRDPMVLTLVADYLRRNDLEPLLPSILAAQLA